LNLIYLEDLIIRILFDILHEGVFSSDENISDDAVFKAFVLFTIAVKDFICSLQVDLFINYGKLKLLPVKGGIRNWQSLFFAE
jgi:hypothetical protein